MFPIFSRHLTRGVVILTLALTSLASRGVSSPVAFPSSLVPFSKIEYVTNPDTSGNRIVFGDTSASDTNLAFYPAPEDVTFLNSLPSPTPGQMFSNDRIELAPNQYFSNVYISTEEQRNGDFRAFDGAIFNPLATYQGQLAPFPENIIPVNLLYSDFFAFEIGPTTPANPTPEPGSFLLVVGPVGFVIAKFFGSKRQTPIR